MESLMSIKLAIKKFVGKNEVFITPILKFLLTLLAMSRISSRLGFFSRLASKPIVLIVALAGSFLPLNLTFVILALIVVAHMYKLSLEVAIVVLALFMILFVLYFRFASEDSVGGVLTPLSFVFHMPCVMPVSMGLKGTPSSMVSVGSGVVIYHMLHYVAEHADELKSGSDGGSKLGQFKTVVDAFVSNKAMIVYAVSFAVTVLVVYLVRRLAIKYAWLVAIATGEIVLFLTAAAANAKLHAGISVGGLFLGIIVSAIINVILCYFCFDLNYNKIEKVQFEDDEYYYYVKAVPKNEFLENPAKKKKAPQRRVSPEAHLRTRPASADRPVSWAERPVRQEIEEEEVRIAPSHGRPVSERAVSDEAAAAIRRTGAARGPLGLSGGRPAGEGRRLQEQRAAAAREAARNKE
ncbi:MAG: hypothetical protein K6A74_08905 [Lachnospiraceae bacterium]|nr:hypothetical protein [Lachnospiraceae bacterium]